MKSTKIISVICAAALVLSAAACQQNSAPQATTALTAVETTAATVAEETSEAPEATTEAETEPALESEENEPGTLNFVITEIKDDMFVGMMTFPYPAHYNIICKTADYPEYTVDDIIEVDYSSMVQTDDFLYEVTPAAIRQGRNDYSLGEETTKTESSVAEVTSAAAETTVSEITAAETEADEESGTLNFRIVEVKEDMFDCMMIFPYPAHYNIMCNTEMYGRYGADDIIEVDYSSMKEVDTFLYEVIPTDIRPGHDNYISDENKKDYSEYEVEDQNGSITLVIDTIYNDGFEGSLPWPYPASYKVMCDTSEYGDYCVNDTIEVSYSFMYKVEEFYYIMEPKEITASDFELNPDVDYKPVIYLYPEETAEVSVKLDYNGELTVTDPAYNGEWRVTASPDGAIINSDGREYEYLFWEGKGSFGFDTTEGDCVSGSETESYLRKNLAYLGLNEKETEDFIEFWLPFMKDNAYNIITFRTNDYTDNAKLEISPAPDTVIRVFMTFQKSDEPVDIAARVLEPAPERNGFTVVEWGGRIIG